MEIAGIHIKHKIMEIHSEKGIIHLWKFMESIKIFASQ